MGETNKEDEDPKIITTWASLTVKWDCSKRPSVKVSKSCQFRGQGSCIPLRHAMLHTAGTSLHGEKVSLPSPQSGVERKR